MDTVKIPNLAYRIQTDRLVLRCWNPADAQLMKTAVDESLEHLLPWMPWAADEPQEIEQKIEILRRFRGEFDLGQNFIYGIFNIDETRVIGGTGLHPRIGEQALEIGYWIHKDFINQGLATEASAALTKVAFTLCSVRRVEIHCDPANVRSASVPRKLGYTHEATLRKRLSGPEGQLADEMIWSLFADQYPSSPSAAAVIEVFDAAMRKITCA
ncbi:MAG: GNAT family N-acetyltransferase [Anaerolineales bacterium]|nr:GNAT family N-acetyltransferase [Anaerolineales bacterium]